MHGSSSNRQQIHISWLIAWLSCAFILGVALVRFAHLSLPLLQTYICTSALLAGAVYLRNRNAVLLVLLAGLLLGYARGYSVQVATNDLQKLYGQNVRITGTITDDPTVTAQGNQRVIIKDIRVDGSNLAGKVWVDTNSHVQLRRSDHVTFRGIVHEGFGTITASMFRANMVHVERTKHGDPGLELRDWFAAAVRTHISEPAASLGVGYLVGQRSSLPESLDEKLRLLGLTHVVVASGYNLTILVRFARRAFVKKSKYLATIAAAGMIVSFVVITGLSPSMSRAALVTGLSLLAWYYGRRLHPLVLLSFAAAITVALNPTYVWGDIGWYLSFTSFAGILILAPLIRIYFYGEQQPPAALQIFIETMSAQLATLPIIAFIFGQYSLLALPANMLILPFVPIAMACTFLAGVCQLVVPSIAAVAALPAQWILTYMTYVIDWLGSIPGAGGSVHFGVGALVCCYVVLILFVIWLLRKTSYTFKDENILL